ncbi:hypothetical protein HN670_00425 [bacterium]|jgi:hypothetical protein|nr:hypothetical protein [bacterium]
MSNFEQQESNAEAQVEKDEIDINQLLEEHGLKLANDPRPKVVSMDNSSPEFSRQETLRDALNSLANIYERAQTDNSGRLRNHGEGAINPTIFQELEHHVAGKKIVYINNPDQAALVELRQKTGEAAIFMWSEQTLVELAEQIDTLIHLEETRVREEQGLKDTEIPTWEFRGQSSFIDSFGQERVILEGRNDPSLKGIVELKFSDEKDKTPEYLSE